MNVKLYSNFIDYYDHHFELDSDLVFYRHMSAGPDRITMLTMMHALGFDVPKHDLVKNLYASMVAEYETEEQLKASKYDNLLQLVIYQNIRSHAGDDKIKMTLAEAYEKHPDLYAAQFIPTIDREGRSMSYRYLSIGKENLWLRYTSTDDWRSNCGNVTIEKVNVSFGVDDKINFDGINLPLYAIDFVPIQHHRSSHMNLCAVDFNVSPGLKGTPVQEMFKPQEIAQLIKDKMVELYEEGKV